MADVMQPVAATQTPVAAICCMCAINIQPNPTNMCLQCLRTQVNIATGLSTRVTMHQCRGCLKYMGGSGGTGWSHYEAESRELMAVCLRKVAGLNRLRLIDAGWIWTEPHSKRLKLKLTVQKEVMNGAVLQEAVVVEFVVRNQQCPDCCASYTIGAWEAIVQVRQRVDHKRTFLHLEQLILKHNAHAQALQIQGFKDGMDFYFAKRNQAARFTEFLETVCPVKVKQSKKLVSQDDHSNIFNYKYTSIIEIVPVCKDDLVVLPTKLAQNLGDIARLSLVQRVLNHLHLVDPITGQTADLTADKFHKAGFEFQALLSAGRLVQFMVLGIEPIMIPTKTSAPVRRANRHRLAEVEVALMADLGVNDTRYRVVTHLGHILRAGDTVLGYLLATASMNSSDAEELEAKTRAGLPDVVLVRKVYSSEGRLKKPAWKLKTFEADEMEVMEARDAEKEDRELEEYRQQLEGDREMRRNVNLYKNDRMSMMAANKTTHMMDGEEILVGEKKAKKRKSKKGLTPETPPTKAGGEEVMGMGEREEVDDDDDDDDEDDDEAVQLDELLDDLELDDPDAPPDDHEAQVLVGEGASAGIRGVSKDFAFTFLPGKGHTGGGVGESGSKKRMDEGEEGFGDDL
ncbi:hypothetical protein VYU27_003489 [Nannochloropsis oceanica]